MDLERIEDVLGNSDGPLPPEQASVVAKYMSSLALVAQRLKKAGDEPEDIDALIDQVAGIPEVAARLARMEAERMGTRQ